MRPLSLDRDLFDRLAQSDGKDLVSIFMPTHSQGRDVSQDGIRLKNLLAEVDTELEHLGFKPRERTARLEQAHGLLEDREFWEHQGQGLAIYIDEEGVCTAVAVGYPIEDSAFVMSVFLMRPLLIELKSPIVPVLALTRGEVALFTATRTAARRVDVHLPESFDDVNWFVDRERQRQQHPDRTDTGRARHGHDPSAREDEDLNRFLREVARAIPGEGTLIVLGDDDLVARFEAVTDRLVMSPPNSGLASPFSERQVIDAAGTVIEQIVSDREEKARADAGARIGTGSAATDIPDAMRGAVTGRIDQLVLDPSFGPVWGRIDESTLDVTIHDEREHPDVDLVDRVLVMSMRNGAEVMPVQEDSGAHPLVAVMRF